MRAAVLETPGDGFDVVRDLDDGKPSVAASPAQADGPDHKISVAP
jgi:hypothetical protein